MKLETKLQFAKRLKSSNLLENIFEEIYNQYFQLIGFVISKYVHKKEDVEELINDVFLKFSKVFITKDIENIQSYLVTIAKNTSIDFIKLKSKLELVYDDTYVENACKDKLDDNLYYDLISDMKLYLTDKEINLIILKSVYGYTFEAIAKKFNEKASSLSSIYNRAIKKFKKGVSSNEN